MVSNRTGNNRTGNNRPHLVKLQGLQQTGTRLRGAAPTVLECLDSDPVAAVLAELLKPDLSAIAQNQLNSSTTWQLYQPIHRVFHLVLLEAICDPYSNENFQPRLDPQKIEGSGLVIRRYGLDSNQQPLSDRSGNPVIQGWRTLTANSADSTVKVEGWRTLTAEHAERDPAQPQAIGYTPAVKTATTSAVSGAHFTLHPTQVASLQEAIETAYTARTTPLFVAPPEVCERHKKTILYGLVPVTSAAVSQSQNADRAFDIDFVKSHLNRFLKAAPSFTLFSGSGDQVGAIAPSASTFQLLFNRLSSENPVEIKKSYSPFVLAGQKLSGRTAAQFSQTDIETNTTNRNIRDFLSLLRQVAIEFEFDKAEQDTNKLTGNSFHIYKKLNTLCIVESNRIERQLGEFLFRSLFLLDSGSTREITLPTHWPDISATFETELASLIMPLLNQRIEISNPQIKQFDEPGYRYHLQAFIRVKRPDGCPPQIHWSEPSPPFTIRPWYDNTPAPAPQVPLPDLLGEPSLLKQLKPNVAFGVPASLFDSIEGMTLQDLLEGKKPASGGLGIGWICGFNIPIITICAFIVLNIFLVLLNFIFGWLPFIKICVPIPQRNQGGN